MRFTIVAYTFPPSKEIGGRRWAKFSQHLVRLGHDVTVVCAGDSGNAEWYEREYPGIDVRVLPKRYPSWLSGYATNIFEKVLYFLAVRIVSPFTKQNLFDKGFAWRRPMLQALEDLNKQRSIDVLVVTGAPFSLLYYGAQFRNRHKEIFYISDLRDPWSWGSYYGIPDMSRAKRKHQVDSEHFTMNVSDIVCFPTENMGNTLLRKYPQLSSKLYLLPHAYDPEKFTSIVKKGKRQGFIYGGSLYPGIDDYIRTLSKVVRSHPAAGFKWDIYTGTHYPLIASIFDEGIVNLHSFIPEEQLFQRIADSAAYLAFFPPSDKDLVSTKFFEIINTRTPILYIGEEGAVGKFITENRLGVHILPARIESDLPKYLNGQVPFEYGYYDITQYSFQTVTKNFVKFVQDHKNNRTVGVEN